LVEVSKVKRINQICVVVKDLDKAVENYWKILGIGPWQIYTVKPPLLEKATYHGKPNSQEFKYAVAAMENIEFELIQPVKGKTIYDDFLKSKGEGLHHILCDGVKDVKEELAAYEKMGAKVTQTAKFGEDEWGYVNTEPLLGTIIEIYKPTGWKYPPPDKVYPPDAKV
jgi:methylmalonyl-CoA/ethylmalonyl-CoA epimerase